MQRPPQDGLRTSEIIEALVPVYSAKTASFVGKTRNLDSRQAEEVIRQQCQCFERLKPYLVEGWAMRVKRRKAQ